MMLIYNHGENFTWGVWFDAVEVIRRQGKERNKRSWRGGRDEDDDDDEAMKDGVKSFWGICESRKMKNEVRVAHL